MAEANFHIEVVTPEQFMGDVIGDINSRRGRIEGMEPQTGGMQVIKAQVPLANLFGYDVRRWPLADL